MRILMWFVIGFVISCAVGIALNFNMLLLLIAGVAAVCALVLCFLRKRAATIAAIILLGFFAGTGYLFLFDAMYLQVARQSDGQVVSGVIEISEYSYETQYGIAADGKLCLEGKTYRVRGYFNDIKSLSPGDTVKGSFKLRFTAAGGEKAATAHPGKGIYLFAYQKDKVTVQSVSGIPLEYFPAQLRRNIQQTLDNIFPDDTEGFARALLLGDSSKLSYEDDTAFKVSGIRHIVAVSGLHVAILVTLVCMFCVNKRVLVTIVGIPVLFLFAAVAGFTPSVTRACIMQALMILAMLFDKDYDPPTALAFAALVILVGNPLAITSVSLQLSAGCVVGILMFSKPISDYIIRLLRCPKGMSLRSRLTRWLAGSISVTLSAMVVTTPLCAYYFGMVSLVGVLTNLFTLWIVSFIFYGIVLACILGMVFLPIGTIVAAVVSWLMRFVLFIAKALAALPMSAVYTCSIYILLWLVAAYALLAVFLMAKKKRPLALAICILVCLVGAIGASWLEPRLDDLRITVLDVGQGQCILVQAEDEHYLIDCGGDTDAIAADTAAEYLLSQGITSLDGIFVTHYDRDHAGGLLPLLTRVNVDTLYLPTLGDDGNIKNDLKSQYADRICWIRTDKTFERPWGRVKAFAGGNSTDDNENGLCILFQAMDCDILITGDRSNAGERRLVENHDLPEVEILVVGHHGAKSSTGFELLSKTRPHIAIISVGRSNNYGHPSQDVLDRLEFFGCTIWRTDLDGTIIYRR